ncbi:MAG TPA: PilZ domain-containing protein [Terriglobales bacterium]|nr:PilZ domain-containing protein [Terriglobales bacterium]
MIGTQAVERRSEPRTPACEPVTVVVEQTDGHVEFPAFLVDRSQRGLCIRHQFKQLPPGRRLRVSLAGDDLHTEVVWNWSVGELVMSGLRLL